MMRMKTRRKIKRAAIKVAMTLLLICSLVGLWKATYYWPDQKVKDEQRIARLEAKNPENYKNIKDMFAEEIEHRTNRNVQSVVFYVSAMDSYWDFHAEVYYKADGVWYTYEADPGSRRLSTELENALFYLIQS